MKSILLVEDDPIVRRSIVRTLERRGFQVIQAGSGEQAIFLLEQLGAGFDVVMTDHDLGDGMDGDDLAAEIAEHYPKIQRFGMSGWIDNWEGAVEAGRVLDAFDKIDAAEKLAEELEK